MQREKVKRNPERYREISLKGCRKYRASLTNEEKYSLHIRSKYGMGLSQYKEMYSAQNGLCAICKETLKLGSATHVDHDHSTNKVRAILCRLCNTALGLVKDNTSVLKKMIQYLQYHRRTT